MRGIALRSSNQKYLSLLSKINKNDRKTGIKVLDLFSGCGGFSLGFEAVGFTTIGFEMKKTFVETYRNNLAGECHCIVLDRDTEYPPADVVIGGPPCQPWSETGKNLGPNDKRDGFPAFINCVEKIRPKIFVAENVRGLSFEKNRKYLQKIISEFTSLGYTVECKLLRMSNYGVPQNRDRLFIVGHMGGFEFPSPQNEIFSVQDALGNAAKYAPKDGRYLTKGEDKYIKSYEEKCKLKTPRDLHLDRPSRTLTCRNLSGSTSDMIRLVMSDGRRRKLRVSEASRLQSFPDWFKFSGSDAEAFEQIGQAVSPVFAYQLAQSVSRYLEQSQSIEAVA